MSLSTQTPSLHLSAQPSPSSRHQLSSPYRCISIDQSIIPHILIMAASTPGAPMPKIIYGTARKGKFSGSLVYTALQAGFRGIDSGVGEHYDEVSVGIGLQRAYEEGIVRRDELYVSKGRWHHQPTTFPISDRPTQYGQSTFH